MGRMAHTHDGVYGVTISATTQKDGGVTDSAFGSGLPPLSIMAFGENVSLIGSFIALLTRNKRRNDLSDHVHRPHGWRGRGRVVPHDVRAVRYRASGVTCEVGR